jgi:plastocyanin
MRVTMKLTAAAIVLAAACSSDAAGPPDGEIWAKDLAFQPAERTIHTGATVTWVNQDGVEHNIAMSEIPTGATASGGPLAANGGTLTLTPTIAGAYKYYCTIHGTPTSGMRGVLTVVVP